MNLAVIPARGGSKGIPRKNLMNIAGYPLIWWSIQACLSSKNINRFIVSTEDEEIAEYSRKNKAEVLERPKNLSEDNSTTIEVLNHISKKIDFKNLVLLQPTSPIRFNGLLDKVLNSHLQNRASTTATGLWCRFYSWGSKPNKTRQTDSGYFYDNGNMYVMSRIDIEKMKWSGEKLNQYPVKSYYHPEIDDIYEANIVEDIIKRFINKYGNNVCSMQEINNYDD